jgi:hypothetical protein
MWFGGYLGIALLASMITLGVMLVLFTDRQASTTMQIEVGDVLSQACNGGDSKFDTCYAFVVRNVSEGGVQGSATCAVTDPEGGLAQFVNGDRTYHSEVIPAGGSAVVLLQVRETDGPTDRPAVACWPSDR